MTPSEADNLIATLPKPGGLQLSREGDQIVMTGGKWGPHSISARVSSAERLLTHWKGYVENQGLSLGPGYTTARPAPELIPHLKTTERDYQPGDKIAFSSPSYQGKHAHGYWPGVVVRATPKRVLVEYSARIDARDFEGYADLFAREGTWQNGNTVRKGRAEIIDLLVGLFGRPPEGFVNRGDYHLVSNPQVDVGVDGARATARSRHLLLMRGPNGEPVPELAGLYEDEFKKVDGRWLIARRNVLNDFIPNRGTGPENPVAEMDALADAAR